MEEFEEKTVDALELTEIVALQEQENGSIAIIVRYGPGRELGLLLAPGLIEELTGALISRPRSGFEPTMAGAGEDESSFAVSEHSVERAEDDTFVLRLASENGPFLTFRMGTKRARKIRDLLTGFLARPPSRRRQ